MVLQQNKKKTLSTIITILIICGCFISVIISGQNKQLQNYTNDNKEVVSVTKEAIDEDEEMITYKDEKTSLIMKVPDGWKSFNEDYKKTYVHPSQKAYIIISTLDYSAAINNMDAKTYSTQVSSSNNTFVNFNKISNSEYLGTYKSVSDVENIIFEYVTWDKSNVIKIEYIIENEYYDELKPIIDTSYDSIKWEKENPIPKELIKYYDSSFDFEFGYPKDWTAKVANNAYACINKNGTASFTVLPSTSKDKLDNISRIKYNDMYISQYNNFSLQSFANDGTYLYAQAFYFANNVQMKMLQTVVATGNHQYIITMEFPYAEAEKYEALYQKCLKEFKSFDNTK